MNDFSIVFLWAEVGSYLEAVLNTLSNSGIPKIHVVHWDKRTTNTTQHIISSSRGVEFSGRSQIDEFAILRILETSRPGVIVISGWMDAGYIWACRQYKRKNPSVKIVAGIDDMWTGSLRQRIGQVYYRLFYRRLFDFVWISGQPQFSFAQRFGYEIGEIVSDLYSADTSLFCTPAALCKRFVFVGRFVKVKAIDLLVDAYCGLPADIQEQWPLYLIGEGDQKPLILKRNNPNIHLLPFLQPEDLRKELLKGGVGCLPSSKDQWGVVLHEYALMGLPILASSGCGAATEFLISGFNGFMFRKGDVADLRRSLLSFTLSTDEQLAQLAQNGRKLGARIDSRISAASLLSVFHLSTGKSDSSN